MFCSPLQPIRDLTRENNMKIVPLLCTVQRWRMLKKPSGLSFLWSDTSPLFKNISHLIFFPLYLFFIFFIQQKFIKLFKYFQSYILLKCKIKCHDIIFF